MYVKHLFSYTFHNPNVHFENFTRRDKIEAGILLSFLFLLELSALICEKALTIRVFRSEMGNCRG